MKDRKGMAITKTDKVKLNKKQFYLLSFTWGLPLTLCGGIVSAAMLATGHKPKRYGWCLYFEAGKNWGGCECGPVFIKCRNSGDRICRHEFGHAIQNCMYGPFMPLVVNMPSSVRYWGRKISGAFGRNPKTDYDAIWFEGQATRLGTEYMSVIRSTEVIEAAGESTEQGV